MEWDVVLFRVMCLRRFVVLLWENLSAALPALADDIGTHGGSPSEVHASRARRITAPCQLHFCWRVVERYRLLGWAALTLPACARKGISSVVQSVRKDSMPLRAAWLRTSEHQVTSSPGRRRRAC